MSKLEQYLGSHRAAHLATLQELTPEQHRAFLLSHRVNLMRQAMTPENGERPSYSEALNEVLKNDYPHYVAETEAKAKAEASRKNRDRRDPNEPFSNSPRRAINEVLHHLAFYGEVGNTVFCSTRDFRRSGQLSGTCDWIAGAGWYRVRRKPHGYSVTKRAEPKPHIPLRAA